LTYISEMTALPKIPMTVDQFLIWAEEELGRYELSNGVVHGMSPETAGHAEVKFGVQAALAAAIRAKRLPCRMLPDGMTVRINEHTAYEPDALVYCGPKVPPDALVVPDPVIVVEVLSPLTRRIDASAKLVGYFNLPSVAHYLIVDPDPHEVIHHARGTGDTILTRIVRNGVLTVDPPGVDLSLDEILAGT
jgi:Uma2 family endonuclease